MKPTILPVLGFALASAVVSPGFAQAAPDSPVAATLPAASSTNEAARKFLSESAAAYAALKTYSSKVEFSQGVGDRVATSAGIFSFARPNKARFELIGEGRVMRAVQDGTEFHLQTKPDSYFSDTYTEANFISGVVAPSGTMASSYLTLLLKGQAPLSTGAQKDWNLSLTKADGVTRISAPYPLGKSDGQLTLEFGSKDKLLRGVEMKAVLPSGPYLNKVVFSETQINPKLAATAFTFAPGPDVKKLTKEEFNAYWDLRLKPGTAPFPLAGKDVTGTERSLEQYKGKVVLVDFWATWCGPCVAEIPNVLSTYEKYHPQGFEVLAVSLDNTKEPLNKFIVDRKIPWPQIFDKESPESLAKRYGVQAIPFVLLIGKDGNIAAVNPRGESLEPALKAALAK